MRGEAEPGDARHGAVQQQPRPQAVPPGQPPAPRLSHTHAGQLPAQEAEGGYQEDGPGGQNSQGMPCIYTFADICAFTSVSTYLIYT